MKHVLTRITWFIKNKTGINNLQKKIGYQSTLLHLTLPEIIPLEKDLIHHVKFSIQKNYQVNDFHHDIHKNDMMFSYILHEQKGNIIQSLMGYYSVGVTFLQGLTNLVQEYNLNTSEILDFGSGYGRTSRFWPVFFPNSKIYISDIKDKALDFQKEHFGFTAIHHDQEPESFPFQQFDLILAISVFTHLPRAGFEKWLEKLQRMLRPGGAIIFTYHDLETHHNKKLAGKNAKEEFVYIENSEEILFNFFSDSNTKLKEYGHSLISQDYLKQQVLSYGLKIIPLDNLLTRSQHAVLIQKMP